MTPKTLHLFCRVIDNLGDVGVCWRLSRQFAQEHFLEVTLWVDDLNSLKKIRHDLNVALSHQQISGVTIRQWPQDQDVFDAASVGDMVIEAFACDLPKAYIAAMALRDKAGMAIPAWFNLEYLSAEDWVEGCHALPSPHPSLSLTKYFFFPGFTPKTGGLILERDLLSRRDDFLDKAQARQSFLEKIGVRLLEAACLVSLFCYDHAPVSAFFEAMQHAPQGVCCLVPEGGASKAVRDFLGQAAVPGASRTKGNLTVQVLPFLEQTEYDKLLWCCDLNFVRGEDSFVRAQWAAKPFIWQIYPQSENTHAIKLDAFLYRYIDDMPSDAALAVTRFHLAWNGLRDAQGFDDKCLSLWENLSVLEQHNGCWAKSLLDNGDLASNLMQFASKIG